MDSNPTPRTQTELGEVVDFALWLMKKVKQRERLKGRFRIYAR